MRYKSGYTEKVRKLCLERNDHKCVVTGETENLEVQHIDGNHTNNELTNLVTLYRDLHVMITGRLSRARRRHPWVRMYFAWLKEHGYPKMTVKYCHSCRGYHMTLGMGEEDVLTP